MEQTQSATYTSLATPSGRTTQGTCWVPSLLVPRRTKLEVLSGHAGAVPSQVPAGQDNPHECTCVPVSLEILKISFLAHFSSSAHPAPKIRGCGQSVFFYPLCLGRILMHAGDTIHASSRATASGTVQGMAPPGSCVSSDTSVRSGEYRVLTDLLSVAVAVLPLPPLSHSNPTRALSESQAGP